MTTTEFNPIIKVIEEAYEIPHLNATRKISALLALRLLLQRKVIKKVLAIDAINYV